MVHLLTRQDARRIAVRAQLLAAERPTDLLGLVRHLALLQVDLTAYVAPNADLVCWSRLGSSYRRTDLEALQEERAVVELRAMLRPAEDIALFRAEMLGWPGSEPRDWELDVADWVTANDGCREDILQRLRSEGPLPARGLPDTCVLPWRSTGWTNNRNVMKLLECMERRGEVAVSSRENRERLWDLADRIYPDDPAVPPEEASRRHAERWLTAMGILRGRAWECHALPHDVASVGEPARIEGVRGMWRVDPAQLGQPFRGRAALLSPLDRLVFDRSRMSEIFEFDYNLEMYKPESKRRWGYFALPILYGDRLVGKLDAEADQAAGVLRVYAVHEDVEFNKTMRAAVDKEIHALANWLDLVLEHALSAR